MTRHDLACGAPGRTVRCGLAGVMFALALAGAAHAQTVDDILERHSAARGDAAQWQAVRSIRMTGRAIAGPGREARVIREVKRPGRIRTEFTFQGMTGVFAFDGRRGWQVSPLTGVLDPRPLPPDEMTAAMAQADFDGTLAASRRQGAMLSLAGRGTVAGRETYRVKVEPKSGPVQEHDLDAETFLLLRSSTTRTVRGRPVTVETTFGDYRSVGGLVFPHAMEMGAHDRPDTVRIAVETIEINPAIDDGRFRMPAGTRR